MNKPTRTTAKISNIIEYPGNIKHFELEPENDLPFKAGQFLNLVIKDEEQVYRRPYSIASKPSQKTLDLCIKLIPNGNLTPKLWKLKIGDQVEIMGGLGLFTIDQCNKDTIVLIGTGTGIAPLRSILFEQIEKEDEKKFHLIFGARYNGEHCYDKEFKEIELNNPNFKYTPILSRPDSKWEGRQGYVQQNLDGIDYENSHVFICGMPEMVDSVKEELLLRGMDENDISTEKY